MSTKTLGTAGTTTLTAVPFGGLSPADIQAISQSIKHDMISTSPIFPGALSHAGLLYIPNRGVLQVLPGDFVGVDATGWPILVGKSAVGSASWVHT